MSATTEEEGRQDGLQTSLKSRHVTMISLGGVIGAGLFVGAEIATIAAAESSEPAKRGDAPQWMVQLNSRGVPARAILAATSIGYLGCASGSGPRTPARGRRARSPPR